MAVRAFSTQFKDQITKTRNLSISLVGLSSEPFEVRAREYEDLAHGTREGDFVSIVDKHLVDNCLDTI